MPAMKIETPAEQLFFTTVYVSGWSSEGRSWTGTGFVYAVPTDKGEAHFLVSNKHVFEGASRLEVRLLRKGSGDSPLWGETASAQWMVAEGEPVCASHPDPEVDVAVIPFGPVVNRLHRQGQTAFFRSFFPGHVPDAAKLQELDALEQVLFVGYPIGLYDTSNFTPIVRRGMTATPLQLDYQGKPAFLIDAAVYPGSSGSPVVLFDRGVYQDREGNTVLGTRFYLLGVLAAVHVREVDAEIIDVANAVARLSQEVGLGIVFRSECLEPCVDEMLSRGGLSRVTEPAVPPVQDGIVTDADRIVADHRE